MEDDLNLAGALDLSGRTSLVTGGGRGIGAGISRVLAAAGSRIIITDADRVGAVGVARSIQGEGGQAIAEEVDVSSNESIEALFRRLADDGEKVSILVNNAGVSGELPIDHPDVLAMWDKQIAVNLSGTFKVTRACSAMLKETRGCVVNLASASSFNAVTRSYSYVASKGGVRSLTQVMAKEMAKDGIRVNAVAPGGIDSPMMTKRKQDQAWMTAFYSRTPMGRLGTDIDVAKVVLFLVSPLAGYVTGVVLPVDGGFLAT